MNLVSDRASSVGYIAACTNQGPLADKINVSISSSSGYVNVQTMLNRLAERNRFVAELERSQLAYESKLYDFFYVLALMAILFFMMIL